METYIEALKTHGEIVVHGFDLALKIHMRFWTEYAIETLVQPIQGTNEFTVTSLKPL